MTQTLIIFTIILCVIAVISKIAGCGFGALLCKYTKRESVQIGAGMVCRGEVALIVAQKGISVGLLSEVFCTSSHHGSRHNTLITDHFKNVICKIRREGQK